MVMETFSMARQKEVSVRPATALFAIGLLMCAVGPAAAQDDPLATFRGALIDYFANFNFVPVLIDHGYAIGDVIEADGVNLMARGSQCFPGLTSPAPVNQSLPAVVKTNAAAVGFGLKLRQIFESNAGADLVKTIQIKFDDVTLVAASRLDLEQKLDRNACADIVPLVDGTLTLVDPKWKPRFVVSEILIGKRQATLTFNDKANLQAKADEIAQQIGSADVSVKLGVDGSVTLSTNQIAVIALKPVTVPKVVVAPPDVRGKGKTQLEWESSDCTSPDACKTLFDPFADLLKSRRPELSADDLEK
jgi:hypothetical protein